MAKLIKDGWCLKCGNCLKPIFLPGIVPSQEMLKEGGWKYCPYCGDYIDYEKREDTKWNALSA